MRLLLIGPECLAADAMRAAEKSKGNSPPWSFRLRPGIRLYKRLWACLATGIPMVFRLGSGPKVSPGANLICTTQTADVDFSREDFSVGPQGDMAGALFASRYDGSDRPLDVFQTPLPSGVSEDVELVPANCADNPLQGPWARARWRAGSTAPQGAPSAIGLSDQPVCSNCI